MNFPEIVINNTSCKHTLHIFLHILPYLIMWIKGHVKPVCKISAADVQFHVYTVYVHVTSVHARVMPRVSRTRRSVCFRMRVRVSTCCLLKICMSFNFERICVFAASMWTHIEGVFVWGSWLTAPFFSQRMKIIYSCFTVCLHACSKMLPCVAKHLAIMFISE